MTKKELNQQVTILNKRVDEMSHEIMKTASENSSLLRTLDDVEEKNRELQIKLNLMTNKANFLSSTVKNLSAVL